MPISSCSSAPISPGAIPVLYQRLAAAKEKRPGMQVVVIDPRRTMTADIADLHLPISPDGDVALFNGLLRHLAGAARSTSAATSRAHTNGFRRRRCAADALDLDAARAARPACRAATLRRVLRAVRRDARRSSPSTARASTSRRPAPTRSTPSSTAISRPAASASPAWGRSRHRPAQRHGRARGRRPRQHARRAYGDRERRSIATACSASGTRRRSPRKPGLKAVDMFRAVADGRIKALWIMATNPVVSMPDADARRGGDRGLPVRRRLGHDRARPTRRGYAHVLLPALAGARRTAPSPIPSAASRASAPSCRRPARRGPTGGSSAEVARRMGFGGAFAYTAAGRDLRRTRGAVGLRERRARAISTSAPWPASTAPTTKTLEPFQWPRPSAIADRRAHVRRRPLLHARCARRASSPCMPAVEPWPRRASRSRSTPAASATSGTP